MAAFSGLEVDISIGSQDITVKKLTISITDNSKVAMSRGMPNGDLPGSVEGTATLEMNTENFNIVLEDAKKAGSFRGIDPFDVMAYMKKSGTNLEHKIEAFGLKPKITDLIDIDTDSEEEIIHKIECSITSSDFVKINGIPYLKNSETKHLS